MNVVFLTGNLAQEPEVRDVNDSVVCELRVATSEWNGKERVPEYHNVVFWGDQAEKVAEHFSKGDGIVIEGSIRTRSWETESGERRYRTEVRGFRWEFPPGRRGDSNGSTANSRPKRVPAPRHSSVAAIPPPGGEPLEPEELGF